MTSQELTLFFAWSLLKIEKTKRQNKANRLRWELANPGKSSKNARAWELAHPERAKEKKAAHYLDNRDEILAEQKRQYDADPTAKLAGNKRWRDNNPEKKKLSDRKGRQKWEAKDGPAQRRKAFKRDISSRQRKALNGIGRAGRTESLLGCSVDAYRAHLENQFSQRPGMSWETRCFWEIDHIRPCASFDLSDPAQQKACFHYSNQRPIWTIENRIKRDKWQPA